MIKICKVSGIRKGCSPKLAQIFEKRRSSCCLGSSIKLSIISLLLVTTAAVGAYYPQQSFEFSPNTPSSQSQIPSNSNNQQMSTNALKPWVQAQLGYMISAPSNWQPVVSPNDGSICLTDSISSSACVWVFSSQGISLEEIVRLKNDIRISAGFQLGESQVLNSDGYTGHMDTYTNRYPNDMTGEYAFYLFLDQSGDVYELMIFGQNIDASPIMQNIVKSFKITDPGPNAPPPPQGINNNQPGSTTLSPEQQYEMNMLAWKMKFKMQQETFDTMMSGIDAIGGSSGDDDWFD